MTKPCLLSADKKSVWDIFDDAIEGERALKQNAFGTSDCLVHGYCEAALRSLKHEAQKTEDRHFASSAPIGDGEIEELEVRLEALRERQDHSYPGFSADFVRPHAYTANPGTRSIDPRLWTNVSSVSCLMRLGAAHIPSQSRRSLTAILCAVSPPSPNQEAKGRRMSDLIRRMAEVFDESMENVHCNDRQPGDYQRWQQRAMREALTLLSRPENISDSAANAAAEAYNGSGDAENYWQQAIAAAIAEMLK